MKKSSLLLILATLAVLSGGTYAYFSDVEKSNATVQAGVLDIVLTDGIASSNSAWEIYNWLPGYPGEIGELRVWNVGNVKGSSLNFDFTMNELEDNDGNVTNGLVNGPESDTAPTTAAGMSKYLYIQSLSLTWFVNDVQQLQQNLVYNGNVTATGASYGLSDLNGNGYFDLDDLKNCGIHNVNPPALDPNHAYYSPPDSYLQMNMNVEFHTSAGNDYQGDITVMNVTVTVNQ